ncbi:MAG: hypothetical protein KDC52_08250, partial [Ignavibacteriae bacterium]|nr:hypothetical protein [Ignavibacteriota bacterium]
IKAEKIFQINEENDIEKIDGINKCTQLIKYKFENFQSDISFLIGSKDNCSAIEGYKNNEVIKSISPPAFLSQDFFYVNIQVFQLAFFERRNIYSYMRADRNTHKGKEPTNYYGFIQSKKEFREKIQLEIMNFDGNSSLGTTKIDSETGQWQMKLSQPLSKGQFLTKDLNGLEHVCGKKFYLIMDFHIDLKVVNRTVKDLYGDVHNLTGKFEQVPLGNMLEWSKDYSITDNLAEKELSRILEKVISSLGKEITICDPYFLGDLKVENNTLRLSKDLFSFLNAVLRSSITGNLNKINVLGYWQKASNRIKSDKIQLINNYKKLFQEVNDNLSRINKKINVDLYFSKLPIHDRYWHGKAEDKEIVYNVSNSINGIIKNGEVRIMPLKGTECYKQQMKLTRRIESAKKENLTNGND